MSIFKNTILWLFKKKKHGYTMIHVLSLTCIIMVHGTKKKIGYCYGVCLKKYDITVRFRKYGNIMLNGKKTLPYNHGIYSNMYY